MAQNFRFKDSGEIRETIALTIKYISKDLRIINVNGQSCIVCPDGSIGRICSDGENVLWIEYADDIKMAERNIFPEDGDGFTVDDYGTIQEMASAMIRELK